MNVRFWIALGLLISVSALAVYAAPRRAKPRAPRKARSVPLPKTRSASPSKTPPAAKRETRVMTPDEARTAVAMLGDAYDLFLMETHAVYHTRPSLPVAAAVIRRVQERMTELGWPRARFLAVNAVVMHPEHVARDDFEKQVVQALRRDDKRIEKVVDGQLRVATVVPLGGGCSSCHWTGGGQSSKAALTWTVPLVADKERR